jgi:hypothetical protein
MKATASNRTTIFALSASIFIAGMNSKSTYSFHTWKVVTKKS